MMFIANKENFRCKLTNTDIIRCLDSYYTTLYTSKHHYSNMSREGYSIHYYKEICTHFEDTYSLQCHFIKSPPPPQIYQTSHLDINISLNMANLHMVNVSAFDFCIWQHLKDNRNEMQLQHLTTIPLFLVNNIYQHIINGTQHIIPFNTTDESTEDTDLIWTLFLHTWIYITAICLLIPAGLGIFCSYFSWCQPARLECWPLQPGNMWYTIVDDDVEVAPIYRCDVKVLSPTRPHEYHGLAIEHLPTQTESQCKQQSKSLVVPIWGSLGKFIQNPWNTEMHATSAARLRFTQHTTTKELMIYRWILDNSCLNNLYNG